jgi:hypothetical protein
MDNLRSLGSTPGKSKTLISSEKRSDSLSSPNTLQFHAREIPSIKRIYKSSVVPQLLLVGKQTQQNEEAHCGTSTYEDQKVTS